jgi:hypothetical protein
VVFQATCARTLLEQEHSRGVRGVRGGQGVSEGVGRVWKYVIFITDYKLPHQFNPATKYYIS